jgi:hypothetical protein
MTLVSVVSAARYSFSGTNTFVVALDVILLNIDIDCNSLLFDKIVF